MRRVVSSVLVLLALSTAAGADKDSQKFSVQPASSYPNRQKIEGVTIAAQVFETADRARTAFGKTNPYQHGVLPVLVIVQNDTGKTVDLTAIRAEYIAVNRDRIEATPPEDVPFLYGNRGRKIRTNPLPTGSTTISRSKNPLAAFEIQSRAFAARMLPPGESAHGFYYFQTGHRAGAILYVTGLREGGGRELFYFEVPLEGVTR